MVLWCYNKFCGTEKKVVVVVSDTPYSAMPSNCICGAEAKLSHMLSCPTGAFPTIRHNEFRDFFANLLTDVSHNVGVEPTLRPTGSRLVDDDSRLDICASGFWAGAFERTYFDVTILNHLCQSNSSLSIPATYSMHEMRKRNKYEHRILQENATFTPIVLSTSGGSSPQTSTFLKHLASKISIKRDCSY